MRRKMEKEVQYMLYRARWGWGGCMTKEEGGGIWGMWKHEGVVSSNVAWRGKDETEGKGGCV